MTEITRLATLADSQQKSDFIGSVSHELRSPLHGILASCEFMQDTDVDAFQRSLIDTADSCARTLLDTINMVLDYSKINTFERSIRKAQKKRQDLSEINEPAPGMQPLLNLYGDVDLAAITEEVVEGVVTGQVFKDSSHYLDIEDLEAASASATARASHRKRTDKPGRAGAGASSIRRPDVEVILDIAPGHWLRITQPGAYRRIVMNLFGNALKYTQSGFIRVKLESFESKQEGAEGLETQRPRTIVKLTVTDSGQGISQEYLRTKLFTPFAQESSVAPGTGLGLSLVRSIITMLHGEIRVTSTKGEGTEVVVTLPMENSSPNGSLSGSTPSTAGSSVERVKDNSPTYVQSQAPGMTVALHFNAQDMCEPQRMVYKCLWQYLSGWYGFDVIDWSVSATPDIVVVEETELPDLLNDRPDVVGAKNGVMLLVICSTASRKSTRRAPVDGPNVGVLYHPFGPYKLAKALRYCIERRGQLLSGDASAGASTSFQIAGNLEQPDDPVDDIITAVSEVKLTSSDPDVPDVNLVQRSDVLANADSAGAQMAIDALPQSDSTNSASASAEPRTDYPFPDPTRDGTVSPETVPTQHPSPTRHDRSRNSSIAPNTPTAAALRHSPLSLRPRPSLEMRRTINPTAPEIAAFQEAVASSTAITAAGAATAAHPGPPPSTRDPRMMLVDDNKINLRLLQTLMKKRRYAVVTSAEDGQQAVDAFRRLISQSPPQPPDIIFIDISMPVKNGFEATREIREVEREVMESLPPSRTPTAALIIALTGLASGRDQSEAFTSGFDLYMTKPVSMREVGRLLDNWRANGGVKGEGVPSGALTGETSEL
ncbi:hypothetical protein LTS18_010671 [Coniosporium uncinatum]|uniref:Uncharacterized protein n=1 Tax=Coniosporium uncinatum TaxID=93489 RepID=A0ACC3DZG8_9PEZI|nr:hypothetical protein LTS18_010671 [Coniosporium uncinatum]